MKSIALVLASFLLFAACGKKTTSADGKKLAAINSQLNARDYEGAIESLESLQKENSDPEIKIKLAHAYAGAAGYETINFTVTLDKVSHTETKGWERRTTKEVLAKVVAAMEPIPTLSPKQKRRLDQSIDLYKELGFSPYTATKEVNFKWGVLHTYRLLTTLKSLILTAKSLAFEEVQMSNEEIEKVAIEHFESMAKDFFDSYLLYVNSYDKLKGIAAKFEEMMQKMSAMKDLKIELAINYSGNTEVKSKEYKDHVEFINDFFAMNSKFTAILVRKAIKLFEAGDYQVAIKDILTNDVPSEEQVLESENKIAILLETFVRQTYSANPIVDYTLKKVFTPALEIEVRDAVNLAVKKRNSEPLKKLYESKSTEMSLLRTSYQIYVKEAQKQKIDQVITEELASLRQYIDAEAIKRKSGVMAQDALADGEVLKNGVEAIIPQEQKMLDEEQKRLEEDQKQLEKDQQSIKKDIERELEKDEQNYQEGYQNAKDEADELSDELNIDHQSEDYKNGKKIIKKVDSQVRR